MSGTYVSTIAGGTMCGGSTIGALASATFGSFQDLIMSPDRRGLLAIDNNYQIKLIDLSTNTVSYWAGSNNMATSLDAEGYQRTANLNGLSALCATPSGDVYVLLSSSRLIKRLFNGWASIVAGNSECVKVPMYSHLHPRIC